MSNVIHYEIFVRRGKSGGWSLLEAIDNRQEALAKAKATLGQGGVVAVKVTKETFKEEDSTFQGVTIFEDGQKAKESEKKEKPLIPCFRPQDLFSHHSRGVIARVLKSTLDEWQLVPMELIHRGDVLEQLEARSTVLQHAVQQVAIAQSAEQPGTLHEVFRLLMDLALKAMDKVVKDERKGRFKPLPGGSVAAFWKQAGTAGDFTYLLAAAIANHIKAAKGWAAKLRFLLELLSDLPEDQKARAECLDTIDAFVAEMIRSPASLHDLLGDCEDLGEALRLMIAVFLGKEIPGSGNRPVSLERLSRSLAHSMLHEARGALAERILAEIKSAKRLHPNSFEQELASMRHLAQRLMQGIGPQLSVDAITEAFGVRSKRLVTQDSIEAYLVGADAVDDRIDRLIQLEENVVGAHSKKAVAGFLMPILLSSKTELQVGGETKPITARLRRIAELQTAIKATHFDDKDKREILKNLDLLGARVAERAQFFKNIEQRAISTADKVLALLRLAAGNGLPEGDCITRVKALVLVLVRRADFMATLMPEDAPSAERQSRLTEFRALFETAGLNKPREEEKEEPPAPPAESAA